MDKCIFCEIVKGNLSCYKIYEDDETLVFLSPGQDIDGHMVAIPKLHCKSILDCPESAMHSLMNTMRTVSRHCVEACAYDGINLLNANETSAGQSVNHLHFHIIPRRSDDGLDAWPAMHNHKYTLKEMQKRLEMR